MYMGSDQIKISNLTQTKVITRIPFINAKSYCCIDCVEDLRLKVLDYVINHVPVINSYDTHTHVCVHVVLICMVL